MAGALTTAEQNELVALERVVGQGIQTFLDVGRALAEIRDRRLYRSSHGTFDDYCHERWLLSRTRAYQLIDVAVVNTVLSTNGGHAHDLPGNERQARELVPLKDDEQAMVEVWRELRQRHGDKLTAHLVKIEVERELGRRPSVDCPGCGRQVLVERIDAPRARRPGTCERCDNKIAVTSTISEYELGDSKRKRVIAERTKVRLETLVGQCSGITRGIPSMRVERAVAVSTDEEITGFIEVIEAGAKTLLELTELLALSRGGSA